MLKRTKLFQALLATGLMAGMNVASAYLWTDAGMTVPVNHDGQYKYTVQGDAYLNGHTYFSGQNSFVDIGGSLYRTRTPGGGMPSSSFTTTLPFTLRMMWFSIL